MYTYSYDELIGKKVSFTYHSPMKDIDPEEFEEVIVETANKEMGIVLLGGRITYYTSDFKKNGKNSYENNDHVMALILNA